jgi:hypothetical protein
LSLSIYKKNDYIYIYISNDIYKHFIIMEEQINVIQIEIHNQPIQVESIPILENDSTDFCLIKLILYNFTSFIIGLIMGGTLGFGLAFIILQNSI